MSKSHASIEGLAKMDAALKLAAKRARAAAEVAVQQEVNAVEADAKEGAAVDSGEMRDGVIGEAGALDGTISATARHSKFVEHGTHKDPAQPFMAPAAERSRTRWPAKAAIVIRAALGGR